MKLKDLLKKSLIVLTIQALWVQSLVFTPTFAQETSAASEIDQLTQEEQDQLKELDISQNLQNMVNDTLEGTKPVMEENDREALRLLGYSDEEIAAISLNSIRDKEERQKFMDRLSTYGTKKSKEIETGAKQTLVPGLASAVIGLAFASLLGIVVGVRCYNQPSGVAFAATSAAWVGLEMMIWKGYQIRMKDINTLMEITQLPAQFQKKFERMRKLVDELKADFQVNEIKDFEVFLENNDAKFQELKGLALEMWDAFHLAKDKQFGALRSLHESIELAAETSRKKARNAKVAAIGYSGSAALAGLESMNVFSGGGQCVGQQDPKGDTTSFTDKLKTGLHLITAAWVLNKTLSAGVNEAQASFASIGDLDKIGIPLGGGLAAAYLGFKKTFADRIYQTGPARAAVFLAMAGIGFLAWKKLEEAAKFLDKQAYEMGVFIEAVDNKLSHFRLTFPTRAAMFGEIKDVLIPQILDILKGLKEKSPEIKAILAGEFEDYKEELEEEKDTVLEEAESALTEASEMAQSEVEELVKNESLEASAIEAELQDLVNPEVAKDLGDINVSDFESELTSSLEHEEWSLFPQAFAAKEAYPLSSTPKSCFLRTQTFLIADENCGCREKKKCPSYNMDFKLKRTQGDSYNQKVMQIGHMITKSSEAILAGNSAAGLKAFSKIGPLIPKLNENTMQILARQTNKSVDRSSIAAIVNKGIDQTKGGLPDYFKGNPSSANKLGKRAQGLKSQVPFKGVDLAASQRVKESLKKKLMLAKELGNTSLKNYKPSITLIGTNTFIQKKKGQQDLSSNSLGEVSTYDIKSINKDNSKSLFDQISKRYLLIQSQGRL